MDAVMNAINEYLDSSQARSMIVELETLLTQNIALAPENGGQGEADKAKALLGYMAENRLVGEGAPCTVERYDAPDSRAASGVRPNVAVTLAGKSGRGVVWVISHLDVVPAGDAAAWQSSPWQVTERDGVLYGRGVEDDQQGIVSSVAAAAAFVKCGVRPSRTMKLLFAADEEVGSEYGMKYLLEQHNLFQKDDLIIIPDGGDPKGETIEVAEKSVLWLRFTVTGLQSHGSRPDLGRNACLAACGLSLALHALEDTFDAHDSLFTPGYSTFSPTMRLANVDGVNIIPGADTFCMDCRVLPCYSLDDVMADVMKACHAAEAKYKVSIKCEVLQRTCSPATSPDAPVVKALSAALMASRGRKAVPVGIGGGTVAALLRSKGYDAAVWSTIDGTAHQKDEHASIANIVQDAKTLAALANGCGTSL